MEQYLTEEERNIVFDTGIFDEIVEGYLISVFEEMDASQETIKDALEKVRFDFTFLGANEVLAIRKGFIDKSL